MDDAESLVVLRCEVRAVIRSMKKAKTIEDLDRQLQGIQNSLTRQYNRTSDSITQNESQMVWYHRRLGFKEGRHRIFTRTCYNLAIYASTQDVRLLRVYHQKKGKEGWY